MATTSLNPFQHLVNSPQETGTSLESLNHTTNSFTDAGNEFAGINEDPPPAYTPTADPYQGEATVGFGPLRPFQQAPPPAPLPASLPAPLPAPERSPTSVPPTQSQSRFEFMPPPRHPSTAGITPTLRSSSSRTSIARPRHPSRTQSQSATSLPDSSTLSFTRPTNSPTPARSFSPPPDPLPPARPFNPPPPRPAPSTQSASVVGTGVGTSTVPEHGRPTTTPMPGHPLLRGGKLLVYPPGFECSKCHNTGYKNNDPSHACGKCWDKYARPYTGALAYAPFPSPSSSSSSGGGSNFQRPLPVFHSPQRSCQVSNNPPMLRKKPSGHKHSRHAPPMSHPAPQHRQAPPLHRPYISPQPPPQIYRPFLTSPIAQQPPPQIIAGPPPVYPPGDPRIGGRLCWRCNGRGGVSFLFFDWETCSVCKGVGRVFN